MGGHGGEKTQAANVHSQHGGVGTVNLPGGMQHRAVAAEHQQQIHRIGQAGGIGLHLALQTGELGGDGIARHRAAGPADQTGGRAHADGARGFFRVPHQSDAFEVVS